MAKMPRIAARVENLLGCGVVSTTPVDGGNVSVATRVRLSDGRMAIVKTRTGAPADFFAAEARGIDRIAATGAIAVADLFGFDETCIVVGWVEPGRPKPEAISEFGAALARLHRHTAAKFGAETDGYIGAIPLPNRELDNWAEFYQKRRLKPYLKFAIERGNISVEDANAIGQVIEKVPELISSTEPPSLLHGDLWNGNVIWPTEGSGTLIDPACYYGHREVDLAMLTLFGIGQFPRILEAYQESYPLETDWEERMPLYQIFPLLVHAGMFGGGYGAKAGAAARKYL